MSKMLKAPLLLSALAILAACDSGTSTAAPAADAAGKAPAAAATPADWTKTVVATPEGGYRMGNPDAPVKIVEYASFTCSHCRDFNQESTKGGFKSQYVAPGKVSYEYRPFLLNIYDFAATRLAACEGAQRFFTWVDQLYGNHDAWVTPFTKLTEADIAPLKSLAPDQQIKGLALAGKLDQFASPRGLARAKLEACLADGPALERLTKAQQAAIDNFQVQGTPTFVLNGKKVDGVTTWAALQTKITEAL
jgi:protein-disulfide isomerase